jgi:hypothetical protein
LIQPLDPADHDLERPVVDPGWLADEAAFNGKFRPCNQL